ncbi:voltage-dependent calcium channel gamma subunit [Anaeramoeba flamelloides]|uniref:Voltage-dependent calcium channel gamma subunit n=1 Tax=Anaeramoeba flamelloides TaxID=1746091 RepID=A0AAV8A548_9EUKA|nr:voltage-dependent calcium channel gamma subunit [Anaeramoeba flamelloides]
MRNSKIFQTIENYDPKSLRKLIAIRKKKELKITKEEVLKWIQLLVNQQDLTFDQQRVTQKMENLTTFRVFLNQEMKLDLDQIFEPEKILQNPHKAEKYLLPSLKILMEKYQETGPFKNEKQEFRTVILLEEDLDLNFDYCKELIKQTETEKILKNIQPTVLIDNVVFNSIIKSKKSDDQENPNNYENTFSKEQAKKFKKKLKKIHLNYSSNDSGSSSSSNSKKSRDSNSSSESGSRSGSGSGSGSDSESNKEENHSNLSSDGNQDEDETEKEEEDESEEDKDKEKEKEEEGDENLNEEELIKIIQQIKKNTKDKKKKLRLIRNNETIVSKWLTKANKKLNYWDLEESKELQKAQNEKTVASKNLSGILSHYEYKPKNENESYLTSLMNYFSHHDNTEILPKQNDKSKSRIKDKQSDQTPNSILARLIKNDFQIKLFESFFFEYLMENDGTIPVERIIKRRTSDFGELHLENPTELINKGKKMIKRTCNRHYRAFKESEKWLQTGNCNWDISVDNSGNEIFRKGKLFLEELGFKILINGVGEIYKRKWKDQNLHLNVDNQRMRRFQLVDDNLNTVYIETKNPNDQSVEKEKKTENFTSWIRKLKRRRENKKNSNNKKNNNKNSAKKKNNLLNKQINLSVFPSLLQPWETEKSYFTTYYRIQKELIIGEKTLKDIMLAYWQKGTILFLIYIATGDDDTLEPGFFLIERNRFSFRVRMNKWYRFYFQKNWLIVQDKKQKNVFKIGKKKKKVFTPHYILTTKTTEETNLILLTVSYFFNLFQDNN